MSRALIDCAVHRLLCDLQTAHARLEAWEKAMAWHARGDPMLWPADLSDVEIELRQRERDQAARSVAARRVSYDAARKQFLVSLGNAFMRAPLEDVPLDGPDIKLDDEGPTSWDDTVETRKPS